MRYEITLDGYVNINGTSYSVKDVPHNLLVELIKYLQDKKCDLINDLDYIFYILSQKEKKAVAETYESYNNRIEEEKRIAHNKFSKERNAALKKLEEEGRHPYF